MLKLLKQVKPLDPPSPFIHLSFPPSPFIQTIILSGKNQNISSLAMEFDLNAIKCGAHPTCIYFQSSK